MKGVLDPPGYDAGKRIKGKKRNVLSDTEHQRIVVCSWPGETMLITPVQLQMHVDLLVSIGCLPSMTVDAPGIHEEAVAGMHGIGVKTPRAAAVADATTGLAGDMHMPNGMMFTIGVLSMMLAATCLPAVVLLIGKTERTDGAIPIVQASFAVITVG